MDDDGAAPDDRDDAAVELVGRYARKRVRPCRGSG
jgi:hypothetical protein